MEEVASKVISLRKKRHARPAISAPKPQVLPSHQGLSSQPPPQLPAAEVAQSRPSLGGKTADLVKRRYSTKLNLPANFDPTAPPVPSIPSLPNQYGIGPPGRPPPLPPDGTSGGPGITLDISALRDPNLQAEAYVNTIFANASEQEINDYQANLRKIRNRTSTDLQQNVYQNRTQFIKISKEAEKLKGEIRTLRNLMSELKANTNALSQASPRNKPGSSDLDETESSLSPPNLRRRGDRSSVADLEVMWSGQLQALWKNVEGSQKFLPAVPGRHILRDSPKWIELNAATWKARRAIHIFLLNDYLLVAARKRKKIDPASDRADSASPKQQLGYSKLIAEHCWPLQDIEMLDLSSKPGQVGRSEGRREQENVGNAINVRVGRESYTFRNDVPDGSEKIGLLHAFRKAVDELDKSLRAELQETVKSKESMDRMARFSDPTLANKLRLSDSFPRNSRDRLNIMIDVDGKQQNMRWVESQIDELDIEIALQSFNESVDRVERLKKLAKGLKSNPTAQMFILGRTEERAQRLASLITRQLVETHSFMKATQRNVAWLVRLGFDDTAREAYLNARGSIVAKRARQCIFEGDLPQYIFQLSFVYFTIIKNTVNIYQACFPPLMMSACVRWAKEQVESFNQILSRQLSALDPKSAVWQDCMDRVTEHVALLTDVGLDFKTLVGVVPQAQAGRGNGPAGLGMRSP